MKFFMAIFVYLLIGAVLGWGIMMLIKGSPWFLVAGLLAYVIAFAKIGCISH